MQGRFYVMNHMGPNPKYICLRRYLRGRDLFCGTVEAQEACVVSPVLAAWHLPRRYSWWDLLMRRDSYFNGHNLELFLATSLFASD
jgi:hypothetical protein